MGIDLEGVRIERVHIPSDMASAVMAEMSRGADVDLMRDSGMPVPEGAETPVEEPVIPLEQDHERLEAMQAQSEQADREANSRRIYLRKLVQEVGTVRRMEGFMINHDRPPNDRDRVEDKNFDVQKKAKITLDRACGSCALASTCQIRGDLGAWIATHPYAKLDTKRLYTGVTNPGISATESRMGFLKRLEADPMAHCIPPTSVAAKKAA